MTVSPASVLRDKVRQSMAIAFFGSACVRGSATGRSARYLTFLLMVVVLMCHGAFGSQHRDASWPSVSGQAHGTVHDGAGASQGEPLDHRGGQPFSSWDYATALFAFLLLSAGLALLLGRGSRRSRMTISRIFDLIPAPPILPFVWGPTVPILQVFRL